MELRIETQKQTLASRDESIKKLMEAMQSKGISSKMMEEERMEMERLRTRNIELETRMRHLESMAEIKDKDAYKVNYYSLPDLPLSGIVRALRPLSLPFPKVLVMKLRHEA